MCLQMSAFEKGLKGIHRRTHTAWGVDLTPISGLMVCVGHYKGLKSLQGCC